MHREAAFLCIVGEAAGKLCICVLCDYFLDADDAEFSYLNTRHPRLSDRRYKFSNTEEENTSAMKQMLLFADML